MSEDLDRSLARVRLLSLDIDGTMTDGGLYYTEAGDVMRKFCVRDGVGLKQVMAAGVATAIVTASTTASIARRAEALGITHLVMGCEDKLAAVSALCARIGIGLDQVAHIGDDINDLGLLRIVGVPVAVADAEDSVRAAAAWVTPRRGGAGAVRDLCERMLRVRTMEEGMTS